MYHVKVMFEYRYFLQTNKYFKRCRDKLKSNSCMNDDHVTAIFIEDGYSVSTLVLNGRIASDDQDKTDMLNKQFSSVYTREDRWNLPSKVKSTNFKMPQITVSSAGVHKLLSQLNA